MEKASFKLDPKIANSSHHIIDLDLCNVRLKDNAYFPWVLLIPRIDNCTEITQLSQNDQQQLMREITLASEKVNTLFQPKKLNVGSLGNIVSQLHIHIVARFENDLLWPHGVWQENSPEQAYTRDQANQITKELSELLR